MSKINTVDLVLLIKTLKEDAESKIDQSKKLKHEADAIIETLSKLESEFEMEIRHFHMESSK